MKNILILITIILLTSPILVLANNHDFGLNALESNLPRKNLIDIVANIINVVLSLLGLIAVCLLVYGGFIWMTSAGNAEQIEKAKKLLVAALIGLLIILLAYSIVSFVIGKLLEATDPSFGSGGSGTGVISNIYGGSLGSGPIENHYPSRNASNIPRNTKIIITFKEDMDRSSLILDKNNNNIFGDSNDDKINQDNVKIYKTADFKPNQPIPYLTKIGIVTTNSKTFVLKPDEFLGNPNNPESYTVLLDAGIKKQNGDKAFGLSGNYVWNFEVSAKIDNTPPKVNSVIPFKNSTEPRNIVVQVNFDEAMDPTSVTGIVPGFNNLQINVGANAISGTYQISNQYQTIEFITTDKCGQSSCGQDVFCLPGGKQITGLIKAATLSDPSSIQGSFPYDGAVDIGGNSLDGNGDGKAKGQGDDYSWQFNTSNEIDITAPSIVTTTPIKSGSSVSLIAPIEIVFNKLMLFSTLNTDNILIKAGEKLWNNSWWISNTNLDENNDTKPEKTQSIINHNKFDNNTAYTVDVKSGVRDLYQNCYFPAKGP